VSVSGIGEELRLERLRQGLSVGEIAERTRISVRYIEAIEADAFDQLPGVVFARNFVRLYALELQLDTNSLVARLPRVDIDAAPMPTPPIHPGRDAWDPRVAATLASVLWLVIAAGAGTGAWYYYNHYGRHTVSTVAAAPPPKAAVPAPQSPASEAAPSAAAQIAETETATTPDNTHPVQVILSAREATWVQVTVDGQTAFAALLRPNDKRNIAADAQVKILTGNAGGLDISLNGKTLDALGPRGQVRTVRLTAEGPQFVPQNPPASAPL
jgi:cytoskeletal protein RodZ